MTGHVDKITAAKSPAMTTIKSFFADTMGVVTLREFWGNGQSFKVAHWFDREFSMVITPASDACARDSFLISADNDVFKRIKKLFNLV
jgi:hypothetical protein